MGVDGDWNWGRLQQYFSKEICDKIKAIHPPVPGAIDRVVWGANSQEMFSIKSCYREFMGERLGVEDRRWEFI